LEVIQLIGPARKSSPPQQSYAFRECGGRCRRRLATRRRCEKPIDLAEVESQPTPDVQHAEAAGVAVDPAATHAEVASDLFDADQLGGIRRVVDELDEPLSNRLDVLAVEGHIS
jgi:hypothetical protein